MTREDIYDHLAQVYLGKRKQADIKKKKQFNAWLIINIFITMTIFASAFYGLTAFLARRDSTLRENVIYSLHRGPINLAYNLNDPYAPVESFSLTIPAMDSTKYNSIIFSLRGKEEGSPGVVKVVFHNAKNETSAYYVQGVGLKWNDYRIPLSEFKEITDWNNLTEVSFVLESWNVGKKKGVILIDNVSFSTNHNNMNSQID